MSAWSSSAVSWWMAVIFLVLCGHCSHHGVGASRTPATANKLLVLMIDGFRWDYFDKFNNSELPGFKKLRENGVSAASLMPVFPSLSLVNYYAVMTGTYSETNGMIDNCMYEVKNNKTEFLIGENPDQYNSYWWDDAEPLWIAAVRQGKRSYFWYWNGCEVEIRGYRPTFCSPYQSTPNPSFEKFSSALDSAVEVLHNGSADLAGVFVEKVDHYGHKEGPNSAKLRETILELDRHLLRLLNVLDQHPNINVILFSDHGMMERLGGPSNNRLGLINVLDYVSESDWDHATGSTAGPVLQIWPKAGELETMYNALKNAHPNLTAYLKQEIPDHYHLKGHYRVPPLYLMADPGYAIVRNASTRTLPYVGFHGYDNSLADMRGIFFAKGPDFKRNKVFNVRPLPNVNLYQLMCHVMQLEPQPHNGTWSNVCDGLADESACADGPWNGAEMMTRLSHECLFLVMMAIAFSWF